MHRIAFTFACCSGTLDWSPKIKNNWYQTTTSFIKMGLDGTSFTVLHTLSEPGTDNENGALPAGPLVFGKDGYLYGVSAGGGSSRVGMMFKVGADGSQFFALHNFTRNEGGYSRAGLTLSRDGNFYGISTDGGANRTGTVFRIVFAGTH